MLLEIIKVETSSVIARIVYNGADLFIEFLENGWYRYRHFPYMLFVEFKNAQSKGTFLNQRIKPNFHGEPCANPVP